jgi:hypothetical protein
LTMHDMSFYTHADVHELSRMVQHRVASEIVKWKQA